MYIKQKRNRSGSICVIVAEKINGKHKLVSTIGTSNQAEEKTQLVRQGEEYIKKIKLERQPEFDFDGAEEKLKKERI